MDKAIQDKIQFKINSDEKREKVVILSEENKQLRNKLMDSEDDLKRHKKQLKQLQSTIEAQSQLQTKLTLLQNDLAYARTQISLKDKDHDETKKSIGNLQRAMTAQVEEHQHQRRVKETECHKLKERTAQLDKMVAAHDDIKKELAELNEAAASKEEQIQISAE